MTELCHGALMHTAELLSAEGSSLSLVKKDSMGCNTLEEVVAPTVLGVVGTWSCAHQELVKGIMGCVLATASPMNLRDIAEVNPLSPHHFP